MYDISMMTEHTRFLCVLLMLMASIINVNGQIYNDYFGNGHHVGIKVSSSDSESTEAAIVTGSQLLVDSISAARFLTQASICYDIEDISHLHQVGIQQWFDEQIALQDSEGFLTKYDTIYHQARAIMIEELGEALVDSVYKDRYVEFVFHEKLFRDSFDLRHKVAFALSQILVVSKEGALNNRGRALSSYYDILYQNAFGNYRDILEQVTYSCAMGIYLSHFKNKKANPDTGALPDENFAREIMQLFTIGLWQLNIDGSQKLQGNTLIPTYDIEDVQELAKVFTGLSGSAYDTFINPHLDGTDLIFTKGKNKWNLAEPMMMYEDFHEPGQKILPDGTVIPSGQLGDQDITVALDWLFNHENVGPFLALRLIQQLVKSSPSPQYIARVAMTFNDNGQGVRGDMAAVIKAILLDPEARDCVHMLDSKAGRLLQPISRLLQIGKALHVDSQDGRLWKRDLTEYNELEQAFLHSPSVFNFFSPFYAENTYVAPNDMLSPEFEILHSTSSIHYINLMEDGLKSSIPFKNYTKSNDSNDNLINDPDNEAFLDFSDHVAIYENDGLDALIDYVDLLFARGQLEASTKEIIRTTIPQFINDSSSYDAYDVVKDVIFFTMMSPNYTILK